MGGPVLVVGALGTVGRKALVSLLEAGLPVRAADLDVRAVHDAFPGVEAAPLDLMDPSTFAPAIDGAGAMFLLRPPAIARVGPTLNALVDEAARRELGHVVFSSVAGADANPLVPHHRVEAHLRASGLSTTILRPGFFAQNLATAYRQDIRDDDRLYVPAGHGSVAFLDVRDLGDVAARVLADPGPHRGQGYLLTGPQALTFDEVALLLSGGLGRPIQYEPATVAGYLQHLAHRGVPVSQRVVQTILHVGLRGGQAEAVDPTLARLLGRHPRTVADYVADHLHLWRSVVGVRSATIPAR